MTDDEEDDLRIMVNLTDDLDEVRNEAICDLLRKHGGVVKGMLRKEFRDKLTENEVQEVLLRTATNAWKYANNYDDTKAKLGTWLVAIALNEARDLIKENQADFALVDEEFLAIQFAKAEVEEEPTKEEKKIVRDFKVVLSRLPRMQKAIIEADLACGDIADGERLAEFHVTSKNSIYVSRNKARATIERELKRMGHFDPQHIPR